MDLTTFQEKIEAIQVYLSQTGPKRYLRDHGAHRTDFLTLRSNAGLRSFTLTAGEMEMVIRQFTTQCWRGNSWRGAEGRRRK
jgi:hypothetical protein